jgi:AcrR family transcriptional regulator
MQDDPPQRRTQTERRLASEEALLDAAAALIADRGIEKASLASIGERAGTSRGLPTHHFRTKDALVGKLASRTQDGVVAATRAALAQVGRTREGLSALDYLRTVVDTYLGLFEHPAAEVLALIVMWGATFPTDASIEGMADADQRSYDGWAELIERGQEDGSIRPDVDPTAASVVLLGMTRGVAAVLLNQHNVADAAKVRTTCAAWITAALETPEPKKRGRPRKP